MDSGLLFTEPDGSPLRPAEVTERFVVLAVRPGCRRSGCTTCVLPPTLALAECGYEGGASMLWHSSITVTMDTYTTVPPGVALAAAEAAAKIIPRTASRPLGLACAGKCRDVQKF